MVAAHAGEFAAAALGALARGAPLSRDCVGEAVLVVLVRASDVVVAVVGAAAVLPLALVDPLRRFCEPLGRSCEMVGSGFEVSLFTEALKAEVRAGMPFGVLVSFAFIDPFSASMWRTALVRSGRAALLSTDFVAAVALTRCRLFSGVLTAEFSSRMTISGLCSREDMAVK